MKGVLILVATLLVVNASIISRVDERKWESFKVDYGKKYLNHEDEMYRKQIFLDNLRKFEEHNRKYEMGLETYTIGVNQFADMTTEDFLAIEMPMPPKRYDNATLFVPPVDYMAEDSKDWRESGAVTGVKNQGGCGSCWAFSATGAMESALFIKNGNLPTLSEQNLLDCVEGGSCKGGSPVAAFQYVINNRGIDSEDSYTYEGQQGQCRYNSQNSAGTISSVGQVEQGNEEALTQAVSSIGPISVIVPSSTLRHYTGGILSKPNCDGILHAILVVGYGSEGGQDYYIVKNSWGESWGEQGYARMARNANNYCGIADHASYPIV